MVNYLLSAGHNDRRQKAHDIMNTIRATIESNIRATIIDIKMLESAIGDCYEVMGRLAMDPECPDHIRDEITKGQIEEVRRIEWFLAQEKARLADLRADLRTAPAPHLLSAR